MKTDENWKDRERGRGSRQPSWQTPGTGRLCRVLFLDDDDMWLVLFVSGPVCIPSPTSHSYFFSFQNPIVFFFILINQTI